jgi:hypothetical protein
MVRFGSALLGTAGRKHRFIYYCVIAGACFDVTILTWCRYTTIWIADFGCALVQWCLECDSCGCCVGGPLLGGGVCGEVATVLTRCLVATSYSRYRGLYLCVILSVVLKVMWVQLWLVKIQWTNSPVQTRILVTGTRENIFAIRISNIKSPPLYCRRRDSAVGIEAGYRLDNRGVGARVPVGSRIFSSPRHPDRLWGPSNLLYNGYWGLFLLG